MNLSANKSRLIALTKEINLRWEDTKSYWHDAKAAKFEHDFMVELFPRLNQATHGIEKLEELLNRIRKDCE